jgi:hypothetical protein
MLLGKKGYKTFQGKDVKVAFNEIPTLLYYTAINSHFAIKKPKILG